MDRRTFLRSSAGLISSLALPGLAGCRKNQTQLPFPGAILGPSYEIGHHLLQGNIPAVSRERKVPVLIVGGGISGLSAGWKFIKAGFEDFEILELEPEVGGVSRSGRNEICAFPWGAHYLPLPTEESRAVRELLEDLGVIQGHTPAGRPIYREEVLCSSPQERLYIHGKWQEGFLPHVGAAEKDLEQFKRFKDLVSFFKRRRGRDGRKAFAIPMEFSSRDPDLLGLDRISISEFLRQKGFDSAPLNWYVNYACRDDYGCHYSQVSAWAGLHYFCSRDGGGENEEGVLTWPEGNGWIVGRLREMLQPKIRTNSLVFRLSPKESEVWAEFYDAREMASCRIRARDVIYACPRIFARRIIEGDGESSFLNDFHYAPWLVANLSLRSLPQSGSGMPLAWDNVIYDSPSLGYVVATHQSLATHIRETVLTYYYAMVDGPPPQERNRLLGTTWEEWTKFILRDLSKAHPEIPDLVNRLDIFRWGHAMVQPRVGFIWGNSRREAARQRGNIHFAHSDLSGFSIFEEAQYRGILAAERILAKHQISFESSL